jgi:U3 small nucleolar RNA-associated protein 13
MWKLDDGSLQGVFKGHKRGVWAAKFSSVDQLIATASTDMTIKIWNIRDFSCVRTLEGHTNTVLDIHFVSLGMQLLSAGSDGLLKLWTIKTGECIDSFDNHEDRIWTLAVDKMEAIVYTGSSDSTITIWKDNTEELKSIQQAEEEEASKKLQDLNIFVKHNDYRNAIILAIELDHPMKLMSILYSLQMNKKDDSVLGSEQVDQYFSTISTPHVNHELI